MVPLGLKLKPNPKAAHNQRMVTDHAMVLNFLHRHHTSNKKKK